MLKTASVTLFAAVMLLLAGCSSVDTSENFNSMDVSIDRSTPIIQVHGIISGIYLFNVIPIFSGSYNHPGKIMVFRDSCTLENTMLMTFRTARGRNASKIINLDSDYQEKWLFWSLILWSREWQVSGTGIK